MSKLVQIRINKSSIIFYGITAQGEIFDYFQKLDGSCDDEKWFELVCEFWDKGCELDWDRVEDTIRKAGK